MAHLSLPLIKQAVCKKMEMDKNNKKAYAIYLTVTAYFLCGTLFGITIAPHFYLGMKIVGRFLIYHSQLFEENTKYLLK